MSLSIARHAKLTKANPELIAPITDSAPVRRELIIYGGEFDGAAVMVARRFAEKDEEGNELPWVNILLPSLVDPIEIKKANAGYVFTDLAQAGWLKIYLVNSGDNTSIQIGVAF